MSATTMAATGAQFDTEDDEYSDSGGSLELDGLNDEDLEKACTAMEQAEASDNRGLLGRTHRMAQMGAQRIGALAIGIGVVGIVLNQMSDLNIVDNSTGVVNVSSIFDTAGQGLELLVIGVIIAAAAVLLSLWSDF